MTKITIEIEEQRVTVESNAVSLPEVLQMMENALKGVGFYFDGHLELIDDKYADEDEDDDDNIGGSANAQDN